MLETPIWSTGGRSEYFAPFEDYTALIKGGCTQVQPLTTMVIRGLRATEPFHWDGIPGDPYGGINTAKIIAGEKANCDVDDPESSTRYLIDNALATTMKTVGDPEVQRRGQTGRVERGRAG